MFYSARSISNDSIRLLNLAGWRLPGSSYDMAANENARKGVSSQVIMKKTAVICHEAYTPADR